MDSIRIRCPKCNWEPDGKPYWQCQCGHQFDTFATAGRCPSCSKEWEYTQCVDFAGGCNDFAPHMEWYQGLDKVVEELKEGLYERVDAARKP
jgi:hypothetical protein